MKNETYLTRHGLLEMQAELDRLVESRRPRLIQLFKDACSLHGSSENAECNSIKEEQDLVEKRILELRALTRSAKIIGDVGAEKVSVGTRTKLEFLSDNKVKTYSIVGTHEINPFEDKISNESPIAQAILGKKINDVATITLGPNKFQVKILGIFAQQEN